MEGDDAKQNRKIVPVGPFNKFGQRDLRLAELRGYKRDLEAPMREKKCGYKNKKYSGPLGKR